jgi:hypothetical protein
MSNNQLIPEEDVQKYLATMSEIRFRLNGIRKILCFQPVDVVSFESILLQIRKSLELIAFSSLVSNKDCYENVRGNVEKDWHAIRILKVVEMANPDFYPEPVVPSKESKLPLLSEGFLSRAEFVKWYDLCGDYMHATNPFIKEKNRSDTLDLIPELITRLELLLQDHMISLSGTEDKIWVSVSFKNLKKTITMRFLHYLREKT